MSLRAELRRQWREDNKAREEQGKPSIPWQQWGIGFKPLAEAAPDLSASAAFLKLGTAAVETAKAFSELPADEKSEVTK